MDHCTQGAASGGEGRAPSPVPVSHEAEPSLPKSGSLSEGGGSGSASSESEQHSDDSVDSSGTEPEDFSWAYRVFRSDAPICEHFRAYGYCHDRRCTRRHLEDRTQDVSRWLLIIVSLSPGPMI